MGDGDDGAFVVAQVMFEPRHGFGVEVVGGFVEQEQMEPVNRRQARPTAPSTIFTF